MKRITALSATSFLLLYIFTSLFLFSCKDDTTEITEDTEISDVRTSGASKYIPLEFAAGSTTVTAITLKNQSTGSSTVHVTLALDSAAVTAAGVKNLRESSYTLSTLEYDVPANGSVNVPITVNRSTLSVDTIYGISFKIVSVSSGAISADANNIVVKVATRNRWDGKYRVTGNFTDVTGSAFVFTEFDTYLVTSEATQVKMFPPDLGIYGYLIKNGINLSYWGSFGPVFNFDASTNAITSVTNHYGQPAANTRAAELDPSGTNMWNATTKNIDVKFWMNESAAVPVAPHHRVSHVNTLVYLGPRP